MTNKMSKTFVTSDIHFNHLQIMKYCNTRAVLTGCERFCAPDYSPSWETDRPAVNAMNDFIVDNWNSEVGPDDHTFIIGDVAMGKIDLAPDLIRRLNGTKTLVAGNHDVTLKKLIKKDETLADLFVGIYDYYELSHVRDPVIRSTPVKIIMSHYPMKHWNHQGHGSIMLHGHLHGSYCGIAGRIKDVGMDTNALKPYALNDIVDQLTKIDVTFDHHGEI